MVLVILVAMVSWGCDEDVTTARPPASTYDPDHGVGECSLGCVPAWTMEEQTLHFIVDHRMELYWLSHGTPQVMGSSDALHYCWSLSVPGIEGLWRPPTTREFMDKLGCFPEGCNPDIQPLPVECSAGCSWEGTDGLFTDRLGITGIHGYYWTHDHHSVVGPQSAVNSRNAGGIRSIRAQFFAICVLPFSAAF